MSDNNDSDSLGGEVQKAWAEFVKDNENARKDMQEAIDEAFEDEGWTVGQITAVVVGSAVAVALLAVAIWRIYEFCA